MLSCREMAEQASDLIEGRAPWRVRASARLHLFLCRYCSRYFHQLRLTMGSVRGMKPAEPAVDVEKVISAIERHHRHLD